MEKHRLSTLLVNVGGDLVHVGEVPITVAIEDPHRPYDNEEPLTRVPICGHGLATSGGARRGFQIQGRWYGVVRNGLGVVRGIHVFLDGPGNLGSVRRVR